MNETRTLVDYCFAVGSHRLPGAVAAQARHLLLDWLGVAAAGAAMEESSRIAREVACESGGAPEATAFGLRERLPAPLAAFVNGVTEHGIEMDDTHSGASSHPGVVIWSAAVAVAERVGVKGDRLLPAAAAGYEMACRAGRACLPPGQYSRGFHPTSTSGVFGAAVAASCLMDLSVSKMLDAVGIAGSFSSGNMEYLAQGTLTKRLQPGQAAHAGILAAQLAAHGYSGPSTILEGHYGFLHAYSDGADATHLTADLGKTWELSLTGIKAYGCCRYMQSAMEAAQRAVRGQAFDPARVKAVRVACLSAGWGLVADPIEQKWAPKTRVDAQFSLPFGVATVLVNGRATVNEFREDQLRNPAILALARKVTLHRDPQADAAYPALWPAWCEIDLDDGRTLRGEVNTTKGEPENPLTAEEVRAKFDALSAGYWTPEQAKTVADLAGTIEEVEVRRLMDFVREGGGGGGK
jgi:2-methylcitrate dehydratase PrpD